MKKEYYSSSRNEMLQYVPENCKTILEIGCGEGNFAEKVKNRTGAFTIGIEYNTEAGRIASKKVDKILIGDANIEISKLDNNSIDLVIFNDVLEHIYYPDLLINLLKPKMSQGGILLASIPNFRYISNLVHIILNKDFKYDKSGGIRDYTHFRFFTKKSINNFFDEIDLQILNIEGIHRTNKKLLKLLFPIFKFFKYDDIYYLQFAVVVKFN